MLYPMCNEALSKVAVPSYLGNVYHCDNCGQDFWYRAVKLFCPRCWKMVDAGYGLFRMDDFSIKQGLCPECLEETGLGKKDD